MDAKTEFNILSSQTLFVSDGKLFTQSQGIKLFVIGFYFTNICLGIMKITNSKYCTYRHHVVDTIEQRFVLFSHAYTKCRENNAMSRKKSLLSFIMETGFTHCLSRILYVVIS